MSLTAFANYGIICVPAVVAHCLAGAVGGFSAGRSLCCYENPGNGTAPCNRMIRSAGMGCVW